MPGTAAERGLADPFDPEEAIPHAARLLSDLRARFGNLGWRPPPTMRVRDGWMPDRRTRSDALGNARLCAGDHRRERRGMAGPPAAARAGAGRAGVLREDHDRAQARTRAPLLEAIAPSRRGRAASGNFSKAVALCPRSNGRSRGSRRCCTMQPMPIGSRLRSRGAHHYRVRAPAQSREKGRGLCDRIHSGRLAWFSRADAESSPLSREKLRAPNCSARMRSSMEWPGSCSSTRSVL